MSRGVTDGRKCYIIECLSCGYLEEVTRSDAITCSTACRVHLHRHPERRDLHVVENLTDDIPRTFLVQFAAYRKLFPDCGDAIMAGTLKVEHPTRRDVLCEEARHAAVIRFRQLVWEAAKERISQQAAKEAAG